MHTRYGLERFRTSQSPARCGGGQIGYNFQPSNWVWGIEADIQSLDLSDSHGAKFRYTTNNAPYNLSTST